MCVVIALWAGGERLQVPFVKWYWWMLSWRSVGLFHHDAYKSDLRSVKLISSALPRPLSV